MELRYKQCGRLFESRKPSNGFLTDLKLIDNALNVVFNRFSGRWEIYRCSRGIYHWILEVSEEDGSYRPLDNRIIKKLYEMDVLRKYGNAKRYDEYLQNKVNSWRKKKDEEDNEDIMSQLKDEKFLWQRAAENAQSGLVNDPPEQKSKKIISYSKEDV